MIAGSATSGSTQGLFHHRPHAALIDVAHGVHLGDSGISDVFLLRLIDVAYADDHGIFRQNLG